ncbi:hypothetical protein Scep_023256 [Stephania cephalantha]|uniref:AP2/ERF domain-containing protein n=1 Tax=Stephania cephalantha TaxID=152367 RepID=A0AAP0HX49_9MAGN
MDDTTSPSWLAFSLSNTTHLPVFDTIRAVDHHDHQTNGGDLPKLEDFLGGGSVAPTLFEADSDLKTLAASFLYSSSTPTTTLTVTTNELSPSDKTTPANVAILAVDSAGKKSVDTFGQRTSIYRGVTRHRWTGRYEAHLWDNSCRREGQSRKGRQGGYDKEDKAARAYDLAALKYWGPTTTTNFPVSDYEKEIEEMKHMSRQEFVASLRRKSSGFSRGASIYRGVTRHHQHGRWQARIGRVAGNKDLYLGTFSTEEEAAEAYDIAAIKFRGLNAVTNFDMSRYDVKSIASSNLPIGGMNKSKPSSNDQSNKGLDRTRSDELDLSSIPFPSPQPSSSSSTTLNFALPIKPDPSSDTTTPTNWYLFNNDTKTNNVATLFQSSLTNGHHGLAMDYYCYCNNNNDNKYWVHHQHQQQSSGSSGGGGGGTNTIPFVAPITVSGNSYESSSYGNWVSASTHSYQSAKPNISVFQTPIFGME